MAKLALSTASTGLMIAAPFTGPAAPFLEAASIALAVGAMLIPPKIPGMAPQQDLQVSSSADGAPIPFGYGQQRFAGQVIWCPGIIYYESMKPDTGKGGSSQTGAVYIYQAGFAVAFGEGPLTIDRIWADSKLIYKGGTDFGTVAPWSPTTPYVQDDLVTYRFYPPIGQGTTQIYQCVVGNTGTIPEGNNLWWVTAPYTFWQSAIQYYPGDQVVYPGLATEDAQAGNIWSCVNPSLNDRPPSSPLHWETLTMYYTPPVLYPGDENQHPDPTIQMVEGVNRAPAFRGIGYAVWDQLPLAAFGNRIPNLRAEITFCAT